jgi:hypothetical protein
VFEAARFGFPDRVPIAVVVAFVGGQRVEHAADRRHVEQESVAFVVKGVELDGEVVVLAEVRAVATHVVGDGALGMLVPAAAHRVEELVVVEHPRFGALGDRRPLVGILLLEFGDGADLLVDRFVEHAVDVKRSTDAGGAHDHAG